ncbi:hypothetical protein B0H13DRAFT_2360242 [Mycena leptocephala]|nr:hypothetical protein B0H13DRAFT_2360242 [Mycena leptocephala]
MAPSQSTLRHGRRPLPFLRRSIPSPQRNPDPLSRDWQLDAAYETLQQYNLIGLPVTWSEQENDWTEWLRPLRVNPRTGRGSTMSARSFANLAELQPPVCPHRFPNRSSVMTLFLNKTYDGRRRDFFQCMNHKCRFVVVILPVNPSVYLTSPAQIAGFNANGVNLRKKKTKSANSLPGFLPWVLRHSLCLLAPVPANHLHLLVLVLGRPQQHHPPIQSTPACTARMMFAPQSYQARYAQHLMYGSQTSAREMSLYQAKRTGLYKDHPEQHPAASLDVAHPLLEVYDSRIYPNCTTRTFASQTYFDTAIGIIIRELNSPLGVAGAHFLSTPTTNIYKEAFVLLIPQAVTFFVAKLMIKRCRAPKADLSPMATILPTQSRLLTPP